MTEASRDISSDAASIRVLVLEDDAALNTLICKRLERAEIPSLPFTRGGDALSHLAEHPEPCLVLLDYHLGDMNAHAFINKLGELPSPPPFVVMTGHGDESLAVEMMKAGALDYLVKSRDFIHQVPEVCGRLIDRLSTELALKASQQRLDQTESRLRILFDQSDQGMLFTDSHGVIIDVNRTYAEILGRTPEELRGKRVADDDLAPHLVRVTKDGDPALPDFHPVRQVMQTGTQCIDRVSGIADRETGATRWVIINAFPLRSQEGKPEIYATYHETTDLLVVQRRLSQSETRLAAIFNNAPIPMLISEAEEGVIISANSAFLQEIGYGEDELVGRKASDFPGLMTHLKRQAILDEIKRYGQARNIESMMETKSGDLTHVVFYAQFIPFGDRDVLLTAIVNITEQKVLEESIWRELKVTSAFAKLYPPLLSDQVSSKEIADLVLDLAKEITGSAYGYVGFIDQETGALHSVTIESMMGEACRITKPDQKIIFPPNSDGTYPALWGESLNRREPFFTNTPSLHASAKGLPAGHVPLDSFLSIPVIVDSRLIAQFALANKPGGYSIDDIHPLERLAKYFSLAYLKRESDALLLEQKTQFSSIIDQATEAIVASDAEGKILIWNPAAERIFGYLADEAIGQSVELIIPESLHQDHRTQVASFLSSREPKVIGTSIELRGRHKKGFLIPLELSLTSWEHDSRVYFASIIRDIRERKEWERSLLEARKEAESANETKGYFLANMSHEIRTPLNGVIGMTGLLQETSLDEEQSEYVETIRKSGESLITIVNDILDFSKIEAGKMQIEKTALDLCELVGDLNDLARIRKGGHPIELLCDFDPNLPCNVTGDGGRIRQVILNLLDNAIKFTPYGSVSLRVVCRERVEQQMIVRFEVIDTGPGVSPKLAEKLFHPFTQKDPTYTRRFGGTGLGLAICKELVTLMGGEIGIESTEGSGATFWIELPFRIDRRRTCRSCIPADIEPDSGTWSLLGDSGSIRIAETILSHARIPAATLTALPPMEERTSNRWILDETVVREHPGILDGFAGGSLIVLGDTLSEELTRRIRGLGVLIPKPFLPERLLRQIQHLSASTNRGASETPHPKRLAAESGRLYRILLAEDNQVNQKVAQKMMERLGYRVDAVANGIEAVEAVRARPYDLVLMDVMMPEMDGLEATLRIRQGNLGKEGLPIIALTAHAMKQDRDRCLESGMNDYLAKPISLASLEKALKTWLPELQTLPT